MSESRRFFAENILGGGTNLPEAESRHAVQVLRLALGATVELFDGRGRLARGRLSDLGNKKSRGAFVEIDELTAVSPPARRLSLIVAGCKGPRLDWLVEKCTELGVFSLIFAEFERSVVHVGANHLEKLRRTAIESCKQCGRLWLPEFATGKRSIDAVAELQRASAPASTAVAICHPGDSSTPMGAWLRDNGPSQATAIVGPEGGLTDAEIAQLTHCGATPVRLARDILRVETAAIAAAACFAASDTS